MPETKTKQRAATTLRIAIGLRSSHVRVCRTGGIYTATVLYTNLGWELIGIDLCQLRGGDRLKLIPQLATDQI